YQTIILQRKTLKNQRKEVQLERDLNLFLKFIEKTEQAIDQFEIDNNRGHQLIEELIFLIPSLDLDNPEKKDKANKNFEYLIKHKTELEKFSSSLLLSSKMLNKILVKHKCDNKTFDFLNMILDSTFDDFLKQILTSCTELYNAILSKEIDPVTGFGDLNIVFYNFKEILTNIEIKCQSQITSTT
ncbi:hypothetical protein BWK58_10115, partial [Flavobacterium columnare]